jgi:hypothetical protein
LVEGSGSGVLMPSKLPREMLRFTDVPERRTRARVLGDPREGVSPVVVLRGMTVSDYLLPACAALAWVTTAWASDNEEHDRPRLGNVGAMGAVLVPVVLVLIVLVLASMAVKRFARTEVERSDRLRDSHRPTLRYLVPPGQDPALVLNALNQAGYEASPDSESGPSSPVVIVGAGNGGAVDREAVRATLVQVSGTNIVPDESGEVERGRVLFEDEYPGRQR